MSQEIPLSKKTIAGLAIRTSNAVAADAIPKAWEQFAQSPVAHQLGEKVTDDVFAVYTDFSHEGESNDGEYTFLLGFEIDSQAQIPDGCTRVEIEASNYHRYAVEDNSPENVYPTWMRIWDNADLKKRFVSDFEHYASSGEISIFVGIES